MVRNFRGIPKQQSLSFSGTPGIQTTRPQTTNLPSLADHLSGWKKKTLPNGGEIHGDLPWVSNPSKNHLNQTNSSRFLKTISKFEDRGSTNLVGGFNQPEKYDRQIGSFLKVGVNIKKYLKPQPSPSFHYDS